MFESEDSRCGAGEKKKKTTTYSTKVSREQLPHFGGYIMHTRSGNIYDAGFVELFGRARSSVDDGQKRPTALSVSDKAPREGFKQLLTPP